jgi:Tfp pilus assembly protein PilE
MEMLITITIIAVMAGVALPTYTRTVERSYWRAAQDVLLTIYAGEQVYHSLQDLYADPAGGGGWPAIYMDNPNSTSIPATFVVTQSGAGAAATFTATATRTSTSKTMTMNQNKVLCNGEPPSSCGTWTKP